MERNYRKDDLIINAIKSIFYRHKERYGSPRITQELKNEGIKINHKKVERLMKKIDIKARIKVHNYHSFKGEVGRICKNVLNRDFSTTKCYQKLGTDITVFIGPWGKLYLSPIIDFHNREILAYDLSEHPDFRQINRMFYDLYNKHGNHLQNAILHSDQGWQYQMQKYREKLKELKMVQSMSRRGNCLDNSPTENFFGRMKEEMFYGYENTFKTINDLKKAIIDYIEYYNKYRIVSKIKMSPLKYKERVYNN